MLPKMNTLSLHDALPISILPLARTLGIDGQVEWLGFVDAAALPSVEPEDRKSTRLNSSHSQISYAVFCLKKKNKFPREARTSGRNCLHILCLTVAER